ncbi:hypothetical protein D3C83_157950 [compost metagenome]
MAITLAVCEMSCGVMGAPITCRRSFFASAMAFGAQATKACAIRSTAASSSAAGTGSWIIPIAFASAAEKRSPEST